MSAATLHRVLLKYSTENFNLERNRFMVNHVSHGIIALYHLKASDQQIEEWADKYASGGLEKAEGPSSSAIFQNDHQPPFDAKSVESLIGARVHFRPIFDHYKGLLEGFGGSVEKLLHAEFPKFVSGIGAHLQHPIIQLGYGLSVNDPQIILEGMAYLHTSDFKPNLTKAELEEPFGKGTANIFEILGEVAADEKLREEIDRAGEKEGNWRDQGAFGNKQNFVFTERASRLNAYINRLKFPEKACGPEPSIKDLLDFVLAVTMKIFVCTAAKNDFVILHLVTGAWSLREVILKGKLEDPVLAIVGSRVILIATVHLYLIQKCHRLHPEYLTPNKDLGSWEELVQETLAAEGHKDEHFYKMVQVARDFASQAPSHDILSKLASRIVLDNPKFFFR